MARVKTIRNLLDSKFTTFPFDGLWAKAMDKPETHGAWIVYGPEKNGKTWFTIKLAEYLSSFALTWYVSAEEGTGKGFVDACKRAKVSDTANGLKFMEYIPIEELDTKLKSRKAAKVIVLDNLTIYADELKATAMRALLLAHPDKLFVFVAHEEKGQPYTAPAKLARKLAKIIIQVRGLTAHISGRCTGGIVSIDEHKAALYWGMPEPTL